MPFKDDEERKAYQRELMRKRREHKRMVMDAPLPIPAHLIPGGKGLPDFVKPYPSVDGQEIEWERRRVPRPVKYDEGDEAAYVERCLAGVAGKDKERLERARSYAVWRYRGWCMGVVASL